MVFNKILKKTTFFLFFDQKTMSSLSKAENEKQRRRFSKQKSLDSYRKITFRLEIFSWKFWCQKLEQLVSKAATMQNLQILRSLIQLKETSVALHFLITFKCLRDVHKQGHFRNCNLSSGRATSHCFVLAAAETAIASESFQLILTRTERRKPFKVNLTSGEHCAISSQDEIRGKSISIARKRNNQAAAEKNILENLITRSVGKFQAFKFLIFHFLKHVKLLSTEFKAQFNGCATFELAFPKWRKVPSASGDFHERAFAAFAGRVCTLCQITEAGAFKTHLRSLTTKVSSGQTGVSGEKPVQRRLSSIFVWNYRLKMCEHVSACHRSIIQWSCVLPDKKQKGAGGGRRQTC